MGPTTPEEALAWAQEALAAGRYIIDPHFTDRCRQRRITLRDARHAILHATQSAPYNREPLAGGTCWRLWGLDLGGEDTAVGFEAFQDHLGRRLLLMTVF